MTWITCLECEAHVSWCDDPEGHTHRDIDTESGSEPEEKQ